MSFPINLSVCTLELSVGLRLVETRSADRVESRLRQSIAGRSQSPQGPDSENTLYSLLLYLLVTNQPVSRSYLPLTIHLNSVKYHRGCFRFFLIIFSKRPRTPPRATSSRTPSPEPTPKAIRIALSPNGTSVTRALLCTLSPTCNPPNVLTYLLNSEELESHHATYHAHVCESRL